LREDKENITDEQRATHSILTRWLKQLYEFLLSKDEWEGNDLSAWSSVVTDIQQHWKTETKQEPFPQLHMLKHAVDFAERYRFLRRASEAQIESFHASFNSLFHKHHLSMSSNTPERLRRCLADATLRIVQAFLEQ
jgi:hypothetical protein